ncbi:uncharacterized protein F4812DRAFT_278146 [Daldinia caldariorum]|uniref:uncharacterized protein n=1 Tax=Daldinia caldariorum TaxID=326644 RepID=UPI00200737F9|nr:uncharacterized protein F4812DRAFT_278146 [Daldinia caldariorum]KAI1470776.1 hypothetical protein F4812DRAFT_278146 [Daldinia caldariorum]
MSLQHQHQAQGSTQYSGMSGPLSECPSLPSAPRSTIPAKRSDDDDIQFISCKPVKKRKTSDRAPKPTGQHQSISPMPITPTPPVFIQPPELKDFDRRVSTGMVGLPSDFNTMELASMLRGVSLPVLEKFVLNQPSRGPRTPSSPELSPKQLPRTVATAMLNTNTNTNFPSPISETSSIKADAKSSTMPPPPVPNTEVLATPKSTRSGSPSSNPATYFAPRLDTIKQPCQICLRMRQQVDLAKSQGFPMFTHNLPHQMVPQIACHQPLHQHLHPQMIAMSPSNMHSFGPGFAPIMMPINNNSFAPLPDHMTNPAQMKQQINEQNHGPSRENVSSHTQPSGSTAAEPHYPAASSPVKPPASLIQPTYRKPSPNLIVDVAETCQEKFPFEDVAKRHNVPVEKVFDVFAAIIQVPLLRCPTDRRRAGKLATTRVKEYTKAKKTIEETRNQNHPDSSDQAIAKPLDIAKHLGQVDLPESFYLG